MFNVKFSIRNKSFSKLNKFLASYVALPKYRELYEYRVGRAWNYKRVFGWFEFDSFESVYFPAWQPGVWTSVCISVNRLTSSILVNINGDLVARTETDLGRDLEWTDQDTVPASTSGIS